MLPYLIEAVAYIERERYREQRFHAWEISVYTQY